MERGVRAGEGEQSWGGRAGRAEQSRAEQGGAETRQWTYVLGQLHGFADDRNVRDLALAEVLERPRDKAGHYEDVNEGRVIGHEYHSLVQRRKVFPPKEAGEAQAHVEGHLGPVVDQPVHASASLQ